MIGKTKISAAGGLVAAAALVFMFFVPAFRGDFVVPAGLDLGWLTIRYYGVIMAIALLAGYSVARTNAWRFGLGREELDRFAFWLAVASLVSARAYFVLFESQYFLDHPVEIFQVWNGGLSIFGAILGGLIFTIAYSRNKAYSAWQALDLIALCLPLGQAIGRFGNFFNYEAYGQPTDLPWRMFVPSENRLTEATHYHPVFLYEAIGSIVIFLLLMRLRGRLGPGRLALSYLMSYAALRFVLEPLRLDSVFVSGWRADQVVAGLVFLGAAAVLVLRPTPRKT